MKNEIKAVIRCNKASNKNNLTHSISTDRVSNMFKSVNITGSLIECKGYITSDKVDLSKEAVAADVGTTLLISDERVGKKLINTLEKIYAERAKNNDNNPTVEISFTAATFSTTQTNILAKGITDISINADAELIDSSEQALANLRNAPRTRLQAANKAAGAVSRFIKQVF